MIGYPGVVDENGDENGDEATHRGPLLSPAIVDREKERPR